MLAGGQSLVPMLALRLALFEHLVDISRHRRAARHRAPRRRRCAIGAGTTAGRRRARAPTVADGRARCWRAATPLIGHFQIRNRGTVGGSIAHADPAAEYPAVALALDAELEVPSARRHARASRRPTSSPACGRPRSSPTSCSPASRFPVWSGRCGFAVEELARRHGDFALAGADRRRRARRRRPGRDAARIGLLGLGPTPIRATRRRGRAAGDGRRPSSTPTRSAGSPSPTSTDAVRPARVGRLPHAASGAVMVARALDRRATGGGPSDELTPLELTVNGQVRRGARSSRGMTLADFLRERLRASPAPTSAASTASAARAPSSSTARPCGPA